MSRKTTFVISVLLVCVLGLPGLSPARAASEDILLKAMKDELVRSLEKLQLEELDKPYFIAYRIDDTNSVSASASLGSLLTSGDNHSRTLYVEVRVGGYDLDNTNFLGTPSFSSSRMVRSFGGVSQLPLDDDYREIRRQVWLATDGAYKQAVEDLAKKRAVLKHKTRTEELADFSKEEAVEIHDDRPPASAEVGDLEELATSISALFRAMPAVYTSTVEALVTNTRTLYVNSEGTSYTRTRPRVRFSAVAATQAADGMLLEDFIAAYGRDVADLPPREELAQRVGELGARLAALRDAELLDRYNGPVLFEGQAAAELFAQVFAPELIAQRRPVVGDERMARMAERSAGAQWEDRLGARVLPRFLSVTDDPTRAELDGTALQATYKVDDEGVPARATAVIERGYLKTLLNGRAPIEGVERSTGNRRGAVVPSNLIVAADRGLSAEELREELLQLVKDREAEFGVLVRRLGNPQLKATADLFGPSRFFSLGGEGQQTVIEPAVAAYKVYPDGREVLLRNVEISGLTAATFKEIVLAGDKPEVTSLPFAARVTDPLRQFSMRGFGGAAPVVSMAVPDLLFEQVVLKKPSGEIPKLPVAERPTYSD